VLRTNRSVVVGASHQPLPSQEFTHSFEPGIAKSAALHSCHSPDHQASGPIPAISSQAGNLIDP